MDNQFALIDQAKSILVDLAIKFGPRVVVAIIIMICGFYAGRYVGRVFDRSLGRLHLDPPVRTLLVRMVRLLVLALFLIMALQNLGVDLLPLIAGLGVAGAGIALADGFSASGFWDQLRATGATMFAGLIGVMAAFLMKAEPRPDDADNPLRACSLNPATDFMIAFAKRFGFRRHGHK